MFSTKYLVKVLNEGFKPNQLIQINDYRLIC